MHILSSFLRIRLLQARVGSPPPLFDPSHPSQRLLLILPLPPVDQQGSFPRSPFRDFSVKCVLLEVKYIFYYPTSTGGKGLPYLYQPQSCRYYFFFSLTAVSLRISLLVFFFFRLAK